MGAELQLTPLLSERIFSERVRLLFHQIPGVVFGVVSSALLSVFLFWQSTPAHIRGIWFTTVLLTGGGALYLYNRYRRVAPAPDQAARWRLRLRAWMALAGGVAGGGGIVLYVPGSLIYQLMLMVLLMAWSGAAVFATATDLPAFNTAIATFLAPFVVRLLVEADSIHAAMAGAVVIFALTLIRFHRNIYHMVMDSLNLRFEYAALAQELEKQKDSAEQANISKSRFLAAASHDLRQPLHALGLFVGELNARLSDHECKAITSKIEASAAAMTGLFDALLDISKLDAGAIEPDVKAFPINELLAGLELENYQQAESKELRFRVVPCTAIIRSDAILLTSILRNLVINAIHYTSFGGIVLGCRRRGDKLVIEVWDSGIGIPENEQQSIFQEFVQLNNPQRDRNKGRGLGLAVAARAASLLDHKIELKSMPGRGSRFSVEVPMAGVQELPVSSFQDFTSPGSQLAGLGVIIIDDDPEILDAMLRLLNIWGCRVLAVTSTEKILDRLGSWPCETDIIIADYRLPGEETGIQAIASIHSALGNTGIPAVLITGDTGPGIVGEAKASGYSVLHKPVHPDRLRQVIGEVAGHRVRRRTRAVSDRY